MTTGELIKKHRKRKKITQKELAEKLGIATNSLSRYETGERNPSISMLKEIAKALEVPQYELMDDEFKQSIHRISEAATSTLKVIDSNEALVNLDALLEQAKQFKKDVQFAEEILKHRNDEAKMREMLEPLSIKELEKLDEIVSYLYWKKKMQLEQNEE